MLSMGDRSLTKDRHLKIVNTKKRRTIMPDIMLHTRNVMIPVVRPVPVKQSFDAPPLKNKPQILKAQNYRNKPALLFSETPSHTLYDPLDSLFEVNYLPTLKVVKKAKRRKAKNQSTKYTVSDKTDSASIKKTSVSQNLYSSKRLSRRGKDEALRFPNTMPTSVKPLASEKEPSGVSSKSIQLSRKCDLLQVRRDRVKDEDKYAVMPKVEMPIDNIVDKSQVASLPSESFYDIVDTVSTVSMLSVSNFRIENKKTFANIGNREKSLIAIASNHPHSSNSEYEINVLHYEDDASSGNKFPRFTPFRLNSPDTNWLPAEDSGAIENQNDGENRNDERVDAIEGSHRKWDASNAVRDIKYSWETTDDWTLPSQARRYNDPYRIHNFERYGERPYDCRIKYSWQVIGTNTQTSRSLLQDLLNNIEDRDKSAYKVCSVKYSWQIIGISTQASLQDSNDTDPDYWNGILLTPSKNYSGNESQIGNNERANLSAKLRDNARYPERGLKRYIILNNQQTQTFAEKNVQADINDFYAKYSWHNLIKQYL